ncbi:flagellar biosynthesis anti-sigma factor FlgM [Idiomarina xiamenensis]|uniref:Negative regulator of flagellin synthesis n=1 Tax=Idiomarina xiamenensis 10-D-4 TaxID=740709 RepID=K2KWN2_9GAMM|nr:flagellar biosynthesis anti-sigma factor FlgM [Idiomarina xiamenensis]EKE82065.1 negative regulator of flagellin synthesis [Idiomarina xiamenensis 10-D-4]
MSINVNNNGVKNTAVDSKQSDTQLRARSENTAQAQASNPAPAKDAVSITPQAQQLNQLQRKAANSSGVDQEKVNSIKAAIENGSYKVDVERLAAKLAQFESDFFGTEDA